jgi:hypothetical protein
MTPIESTFSLDVNSKLDWWVSGLVSVLMKLGLYWLKSRIIA